LGIHQQRLSTGKRINSAADDPAGLTIATKMFSRSDGLKTALDNIGDAKNLLSVAESGLTNISDILVQMRDKAQAAGSDTMGIEEREAIRKQLKAFALQIDDSVDQTKWNGQKLLDGLQAFTGNKLVFQTGADSSDTTVLSGMSNLSTSSLGIMDTASASSVVTGSTLDLGKILASSTAVSGTGGTSATTSGDYSIQLSIGDQTVSATLTFGGTTVTSASVALGAAGATTSVSVGGFTLVVKSADTTAALAGTYNVNFEFVKEADKYINLDNTDSLDFRNYMARAEAAMNTVNNQISQVGALLGRLTFKEDQVSVSQVNVEASYNRIMNANMAAEQVEATKMSILQQTAMTMLAQANVAPQAVLALFR
jgi:flagellin